MISICKLFIPFFFAEGQKVPINMGHFFAEGQKVPINMGHQYLQSME
jgi:hypothetical protein